MKFFLHFSFKDKEGWFEKAFWHEEGSFPFMAFFNVYVVESPDNIHFGEQFPIFQYIKKVINVG